MKLSVLVAALALAASPAFAESVRVVDGDTLKIDGVTYRLWGIDAPEAAPTVRRWVARRTGCHRSLARPHR
jgi:endonuclease YncB( thermonuclease family)